MCLFVVQTERSFSPEIISNLINCVGLCVHTHAKHLMALGAIKIIVKRLVSTEIHLTVNVISQSLLFNLVVPVCWALIRDTSIVNLDRLSWIVYASGLLMRLGPAEWPCPRPAMWLNAQLLFSSLVLSNFCQTTTAQHLSPSYKIPRKSLALKEYSWFHTG